MYDHLLFLFFVPGCVFFMIKIQNVYWHSNDVYSHRPVIKNLGAAHRLNAQLERSSDPKWVNYSKSDRTSAKSIPLKNFPAPKTKTSFMQTLIIPLIDCGDVSYFVLNVDFLNKLDPLLNNCIRIILILA